jgi:trehalose-phosphatase
VELIPIVKSRIQEALVGYENLLLREGKKVFEVLPKDSTTKGDALEAILRKVASDRNVDLYPVYFGDDITDKHIYDFLRKLGKGITVFVQGRDPIHLEADLVLDGPGEVLKEMTFLVHGTY